MFRNLIKEDAQIYSKYIAQYIIEFIIFLPFLQLIKSMHVTNNKQFSNEHLYIYCVHSYIFIKKIKINENSNYDLHIPGINVHSISIGLPHILLFCKPRCVWIERYRQLPD